MSGQRESSVAKPWRVKFDGVCSRCARPLVRGTPAVWERSTRTIRCIECPTPAGEPPTPPIDGVAGASARREHERRTARREADVRGRWGGRVGGFILKVSDEPQSTRAWSTGAAGEEKLARELAGIDGIRMLHDRRVRGSRANIDHIVLAPGGVFVVDSKNYRGLIRVRDRGPFWREDLRLFVGRRDCSDLAVALTRQVDAVSRVFVETEDGPLPLVTPVLCFVDGEWPLLRRPREFRGVQLTDQHSISAVLTAHPYLDPPSIDRWSRVLAERLPPR